MGLQTQGSKCKVLKLVENITSVTMRHHHLMQSLWSSAQQLVLFLRIDHTQALSTIEASFSFEREFHSGSVLPIVRCL